MQVINLTKRKFKTLKPLELSSGVLNNEAKLYLLPNKTLWQKSPLVFKKLNQISGLNFANKLYTVSSLIDNRMDLGIEELILPTSLVAISDEVSGPGFPYIPSYNFQDILDDYYDVSLEQKVAYFKQIGEILEKVRKIREYTKVKDFYLNDIHESNFIVNNLTGKINVVDLDSCKILNNLTFASKYLVPMGLIGASSKYVFKENTLGSFYKVDNNTELYCYYIMILQFFYGSSMVNMSINEYFIYLDYLASLGIAKEIIDLFSYIVINKDNINPYEYLEELIPYYSKMHQREFIKVRDKGGR